MTESGSAPPGPMTRPAESERRLQLALSAGRGIGTWDWDVPNDRVVADERFARLHGVDPEKARAGAPIADFFVAMHPEDVPGLRARIADALRTGELFSVEYRLVHGEGEVTWVIAEGRCDIDSSGRPLRFSGVSLDITERKLAEEKLHDLNAELERKIIERSQTRGRTWQVSPDLLGALNSKGYFETSNPAWRVVLGWSEQEVASMSIFELLHPDDVERTRLGFNLTQQGQPAIRFPNRYRRKDGTYRWISWVGVPEDGMVYCSGRDITEEKEQADALVRAESALRQAQKMEAIGQLTGGIAHDFNNLLQVISANLQLIGRLVGGNEQVDKRLGSALAAVQRGAKLSNQLLAFGRKQALNPRVINVGRLLADLEDLLHRSLGENIQIETLIGAGLWNALADPGQLESALLNLAINAREAMEGKGKLTIEVHNASLDDDYVRENPDVAVGQYVAIVVTDTGAGMPAEVAAQAFEPFFTTKPVGQGTGLGLAMVYGFMKQSGGSAKLYSEVGHGTTVRLYLPRSWAEGDAASADPAADSFEGGPETILVAEDDEAVRTTSVDLLKQLGYRVLQAPNADAALALVDGGARVDLLFTDVVMPGLINSSELARRARLRLPGLAVLYTSGYAQSAIVHGGRLDADVNLLSKPYTGEALARKVRHVLANHAMRSLATRDPRDEHGSARLAAGALPLQVLLVEDDDSIRETTGKLLRNLGHTVLECAGVEEAWLLLRTSRIDLLVADVELKAGSGVELAGQARGFDAEIGVIFASGGAHSRALGIGRNAALLKKPFDGTDVAAAVSTAMDR